MDQASAAAMHISKTSCSRYGVNISKYLQAKTVNVMEGVASVSIMFDEASDIQMHKHLNVFVNVIFFGVVFLLVYRVLVVWQFLLYVFV